MRLASAIYYDVKVQFRSGFYYAYLIVCLIYVAALRQVPGNLSRTITTIVIFLDPSILGFYFISGLILLEIKQQTLQSLFITPLSVSEYLIAKALSLTVLALLSSILITVSIIGLDFNITLFCSTVILTSILFVFVGIAVVVRVKDINHYLILSPLPLIFIILPLLDYLDIFKTKLYYLLPSHPIIKLLSNSIENSNQNVIYNFIPISIWVVISYFWAYNWFNKYIVERQRG
jgi:fluoroquinolone transport system permease protein